MVPRSVKEEIKAQLEAVPSAVNDTNKELQNKLPSVLILHNIGYNTEEDFVEFSHIPELNLLEAFLPSIEKRR